jgi:hypothetical protein
MALRPEVSLPIALATGAVVYGIFQTHLPPVAESKVTMPGNQHLQSSRRTATWTAAAVVGGISLLAADPTIFIVGGTMVAVLDFTHRHADAVHPQTGQVVGMNATGSATAAYPGNSASVTDGAGAQGS